jgi:hypothetical protein
MDLMLTLFGPYCVTFVVNSLKRLMIHTAKKETYTVHVGESESIQKNFLSFNFVVLAILIIVHAGESKKPQCHYEAVLTLPGKILQCRLK